jgi:hypothetical protein
MICPICQSQNQQDSIFCAGCGQRLHFFCPACGERIAEEINYCIKCGHSFHIYPPSMLVRTEKGKEELDNEPEKEERHREYYMPRVRSARIASSLHGLLGITEDNNISDMRRDHLEHSLAYVFEDPWLSLHDDNDVSGFLQDYWRAIKELWPEAFHEANGYYIKDMLGFSILNKVFPDVIQLCRKSSDFSKETMKRILSQTGIKSDFWLESTVTRGKFDSGIKAFISDTAPFITTPESCINTAIAHIREKLGTVTSILPGTFTGGEQVIYS